MNQRNLSGMNAAHAFEPKRPRTLGPAPQSVHITYVAKNGIDGLHSQRPRCVHQARAGVERFAAFHCLDRAQVGGVVFEPDSERHHILAGLCDGDAFSIPRADSRIGISQMGRVMP